ncbi:Ankyrin repeat-containing domain protein [Cordyceps fumosorosea ARSEF 2679]|uniref:Ankyrin repeat-containing domain protein n=1 Tax=Cordyceps fumosorosea (strain ARSEF 2679) TaxID=1081104 RepID=A0A167NNQ6_CORFA|nr:Ankyrin repeat-containing domain protein [Cordyceps fumosorosea ARSEF 2679]OAA55763.1 Ankyrin repeat-containing domain protein [Cordyceps fumosorosea ARSEF 2679]
MFMFRFLLVSFSLSTILSATACSVLQNLAALDPIISDPGEQDTSSYNTLASQEWTHAAYDAHMARLCQSIVDGDIDIVLDCLSQPDTDLNKRDYAGRTPLHLAVITSTPGIVRSLVNHGSCLTARLANGKTALHLAATRGNAEIINTLMERSIENEKGGEERHADRRKAANGYMPDTETKHAAAGIEDDGNDVPEGSEDGADYYQIDSLAWDTPCSPLYLAIVEGNEEAVKLLCDYGANVTLPIKTFNPDFDVDDFDKFNDYDDFDGYDDTKTVLALTFALSLPPEKARSMARLLLKLGATSSQADSRGCTAFQKFVDAGGDMIDVLLENDKVGTEAAINHLAFHEPSSTTPTTSPLLRAVEKEDFAVVIKLLNAGASVQIDFDTWLKAAKSSPDHKLGDLERSRRAYKESVDQPLIVAIRVGNIDAAFKFLEIGADPNALTSDTQRLLIDESEYARMDVSGKSALDLVRDLAEALSVHDDETTDHNRPFLPVGMEEYLQNTEPGTYRHWMISKDIKLVKEAFKRDDTFYQGELKPHETSPAAAEKKTAVEGALARVKSLEDALIAKGGKVFTELYPHIDAQDCGTRCCNRVTKTPSEYKFTFQFTRDIDITDARRDGYIQLMEAAWAGDLNRLNSMTLEAWGPGKGQAPLKVAIVDNSGNSPFSLAFLRGHHDVARTILEIAKVQWPSSESDQAQEEENDEGWLAYHSYFSGDELRMDLQKAVRPHTKPLEMICDGTPTFLVENGVITAEYGTRSLFMHTLDTEDASGLEALLDMVQHLSGQNLAKDDERSEQSFTFPASVFRWTIETGKLRFLDLIIKRTGAGIPLDDLAWKKPDFYQWMPICAGTITEWEENAREEATRVLAMESPPLLHAALGGSLEGVKFFSGDAPHRLYSEFGKSETARYDARLTSLREGPEGFDGAISKWLKADNDLVIHCAVLSHVNEESVELLEYLVKKYPELIQKKNSDGESPLMLACRLGRIEYVKVLLAAGADQSTRNARGENIICRSQWQPYGGSAQTPSRPYRLGFEEPLVLAAHESTGAPLYPPARLDLAALDDYYYFTIGYSRAPKPYRDQRVVVAVANLLLEYSKGEELDMLNRAGETCLHTAVKGEMGSLVRTLINFSPRLLMLENAAGRTPAEIAHERGQRQILDPWSPSGDFEHSVIRLARDDVDDFAVSAALNHQSPDELRTKLRGLGLSDDYDTKVIDRLLLAIGCGESSDWGYPPSTIMKKIVSDLCSTALAEHPGKRRLVSLDEANDMTGRRGVQDTASPTFSVQSHNLDYDVHNNLDYDVQDDLDYDVQGNLDYDVQYLQEPGDFVVKEMQKRLCGAWHFSDYEAGQLGLEQGKPEELDDGAHIGLRRCGMCGEYENEHDVPRQFPIYE